MSMLFSGRSRSIAGVLSLSLFVSLVFTTAARAQPLVEQVPADAIVYVGWLGWDAKSPGFEGSHLKAILEAGEFQKLINETLPAVMEKIAAQDQNAAQAMGLAKPILMPMLKHPTAVFIAKPIMARDQPPMPKAGIICQAGADADAMLGQIQKLLAEGPPDMQQMVKATKQGDAVVVTLGYPEGLPAAAGGLAGSAGFKAIQPHAVKNASFMVYVDIESFLASTEQALDLYVQDEEPKAYWPKIRDAIGLKSMKRFVWSSGFDGKEWMDHAFLAAPEPRTGLVALANPAPLSEGALKSIPMTATLAGATKFDVAKLIAGLREAVVSVEPRAAQDIDRAFAEASKAIGMDVQKDLLATLGDEWVYYVDPMTGGRGLGGIVMLNRLKDAAKAEQAFAKLETLINDELKKNIKEENVEIRFRTTKSGNTTIHYLGTPLISPAWAIKDGTLMIAMFPQMVAGAADQIGAQKSILDNPTFQAVRQRLAVTNACEVVFLDLPRTAPDSYASWVAISRLVNFTDVLGAPAPAMLLPPLNKLMPHLTPAGSVTWVDKDGIHLKAITPFPGATIFATDPMGGMQMMAPVMMGVALPSLNRAREQANQVKSMSNLRQIALAAIIYANEHKGKFPETMAELAASGDLHPGMFIHPSSQKTAPPPFADPKAFGRWAEESGDYVWVGKGFNANRAGPDVVIAHERQETSRDGMVNAAFADGHVERITIPDLTQRLNKPQN